MKKFILCASFVTLLGEGAEAHNIKFTNTTNLKWECKYDHLFHFDLAAKSTKDEPLFAEVTCTSGKYSVSCEFVDEKFVIKKSKSFGHYYCEDQEAH